MAVPGTCCTCCEPLCRTCVARLRRAPFAHSQTRSGRTLLGQEQPQSGLQAPVFSQGAYNRSSPVFCLRHGGVQQLLSAPCGEAFAMS